MFSIRHLRAISTAPRRGQVVGRSCLVVAVLAGIMLAGPAAAATGQVRETSLQVAARVLSVLRMQVLDHPRSILVSAADIARGEMTISGGALAIASNAARGYSLHGELNDAAFRDFEMTGFTRPLRQGAALVVGATAIGSLRNPAPIAVTYRLVLAANTSPGTYTWPVTLDLVAN